jgi:hypothetical protein
MRTLPFSIAWRNTGTHKENENSSGYDKLVADNAALARRLAKTERDLEELRAQWAVSVSHLLLARLLLTWPKQDARKSFSCSSGGRVGRYRLEGGISSCEPVTFQPRRWMGW